MTVKIIATFVGKNWKTILVATEAIAGSAKVIYDKLISKQSPALVDTKSDINIQIAAILERIQILEASDTAQISLTKQITEQLQGLASGLNEVAARSLISLWLGVGAILISGLTLLFISTR